MSGHTQAPQLTFNVIESSAGTRMARFHVSDAKNGVVLKCFQIDAVTDGRRKTA